MVPILLFILRPNILTAMAPAWVELLLIVVNLPGQKRNILSYVHTDTSYHGLKYVDKFGPLAYIVKARAQYMRDLGVTPAPQNTWLMNHGLITLHLRMERHSSNALALAKFLENHPQVSWVNYPGLESHPSYVLTHKYLPLGASGVLTFGIKGGREAGMKFMEACNLIAMVVHVGDARSCVLHPASTTHRQLSEETTDRFWCQPRFDQTFSGD